MYIFIHYRFEGKLVPILEHFHTVLISINSRIRAESFKVYDYIHVHSLSSITSLYHHFIFSASSHPPFSFSFSSSFFSSFFSFSSSSSSSFPLRSVESWSVFKRGISYLFIILILLISWENCLLGNLKKKLRRRKHLYAACLIVPFI